jgi:hypothetical protein
VPWTGASSDEVPECGADYPTAAAAGSSDLQWDAAECACSCDAATGITCKDATLHIFDPNGCNQGALATHVVQENDCLDIPVNNASKFVTTDDFEVNSAGACEPLLNETIDPPSFGLQFAGCGGAVNEGGCEDDDLCLPEIDNPWDEVWCVYAQGDLDCPSGGYSEKAVYFAGVDDTRDCGDCTCGDPTSVCEGKVRVHEDDACMSNLFISGKPATCSNLGLMKPSSLFWESEPSGSCVEGGGAPTGDVTPNGPVTVCCQP